MIWVLSPGDVVTHYRVISPLGAGGMGQVYLAEDARLGRRLALKLLPPRAGATRAGCGVSSAKRARSPR
jgi:serine/threonine protein kinase